MTDAERQNDGAQQLGHDVQKRLRRWRIRLFGQRLLFTLSAIAILFLLAHWLGTPLTMLMQQVLAFCLVSFTQLVLSSRWRNLSTDNFLLHLNRRFPDFEESAQLLVREADALGPLQQLQRERAFAVFKKNLAQVEQWQTPFHSRWPAIILLSCGLLYMLTGQLASLAGKIVPENLITPAGLLGDSGSPGLKDILIRIQPPAYTGLAFFETDQLDIELPEGSRVDWRLSFATTDDKFALLVSPDTRVDLVAEADDKLHGHAVINQTGLYRIVRNPGGKEETTGDIYSLAVTLDQAPDIRFIEPQVSSLEIPRSGPANFKSQALVKDDYGVKNVDILASVAKGSGEGVKFRDEKLEFDQYVETEKGLLYEKSWDLEALGMEPGDEVYFTVIASDNRQPEANTGRSETLIVRWLDDEVDGLAAEGLAIDFIPEFFKSQRQIIIDTEQLIEDKPHLPLQAFKDSSYETGQAQADLKQKYGQYLGDEFGEGPGEQFEPRTDASDGGGETDEHDAHNHGGDHGGEINNENSGQNLNNMADIVRLFGHDHGDPEIGPITRRNPVALMKRAVNEMWQAEKHLMQAEPELALPFEYEAYKYLKLARQADRIYVKRLGFEPPPVSEERRLTGELDEILSYRLSTVEPVIDPGSEQWNQRLLKSTYLLLTSYSSQYELDDSDRELLQRLSIEFTNWSQQRAALIRHAATLEKLSLAGQLNLDNCESCLQDLEHTIWNLISDGAGQLKQGDATWYADDEMVQSYQKALQQASDINTASSTTGGDHQ